MFPKPLDNFSMFIVVKSLDLDMWKLKVHNYHQVIISNPPSHIFDFVMIIYQLRGKEINWNWVLVVK